MKAQGANYPTDTLTSGASPSSQTALQAFAIKTRIRKLLCKSSDVMSRVQASFLLSAARCQQQEPSWQTPGFLNVAQLPAWGLQAPCYAIISAAPGIALTRMQADNIVTKSAKDAWQAFGKPTKNARQYLISVQAPLRPLARMWPRAAYNPLG